MSSKANQLALRAILKLVVCIAALFAIRSLIVELPSFIENWQTPKARNQANTTVLYTATAPLSTPTRRILTPPPSQARHFSLRVVPKQWSKQIDLPVGYTAYVTFMLGRIRIERNGIDEGIIFRQPAVSAGPGGQLSLHPLSVMLNKTPRTIVFNPDTRSLRFMSGESEEGEIEVELR